MTEVEFVSVKDACKLLECGRTKIYTHYLAKGILQIKKKVGNRSYFTKSDILEAKAKEERESLEVFFQPNLQTKTQDPKEEPPQTSSQAKEGSLPQPEEQNQEEKLENEKTEKEQIEPNSDDIEPIEPSKLLVPAKQSQSKDSNEVLVTDYISELKQTIHGLEQTIEDQKEILHQYKEKIKDSISLLEHNNKLKQNEKLLLESKERIQAIEDKNIELEEAKTTLEKENEEKNSKLNKSVQVALHIKKQLDQELEKKETLQKLQTRWKEVQAKLRECGFFDFSTKAKLKRELEQIQVSIQNFS